MPYPNEHSCRIKPPGDFQAGSFRRIKRGSKTGEGARDGKQLSIIIGRPKGKTTTTTQAYRYPKDDWTEAQARSHCKEEGGAFEAASGQEESESVVVGDEVLFREDFMALQACLISEVIRKEGDEIILYDSEGEKVLGRFPFGKGKKYKDEETARAAAKKREGQIQFFKHKEYKAHTMSTNNVLISVNAIDVDGEAVPVAELVAAYEEQRGQGQGQGGPHQGDGGADVCVCPKCGEEAPHEKGTPCNEMECPECGAAMVGKESSAKESAETDMNKVRDLLQEALAMLDAPVEMEEVQLSESATFDAFMPEGDHSATILEVVKEAGIEPGEGRRAPVVMDLQIIKPGPGNKRDNRYYLPETLKKYGHVFENADIFVTDHKASERGEKTKVGRIRKCPSRFTEEGAIIGRTIVYDPDMAEKIRNRADAGELDTLHCSILGTGDVQPGKVDGKKYGIVKSINPNPLVEFVSRAGAGGHAISLAESNTGGVNMDKEQIEKLLSESDLPQDAQERLAGAEYEDEEAVKEAILKEKAQEAPQMLAEADVGEAVDATKLPAFAKAALKTRSYADEAELKEAVESATKEVAKLTGSGQPFGQGSSRAAGEKPLSERDRIIEFNKIMDAVGGRQVPVPAEQQ